MDLFGKFMAGLIGIVVSLGLATITTIYLWGWFIVPFGLPPLNIPWAMRVSLFVGRATMTECKKDDKTFTFRIIESCLMSGFVLLMGWLISLAM